MQFGIVGVDGKTPIFVPRDGRWNMWSIHDIYLGELGVKQIYT